MGDDDMVVAVVQIPRLKDSPQRKRCVENMMDYVVAGLVTASGVGNDR
jgi:hypothetical protein